MTCQILKKMLCGLHTDQVFSLLGLLSPATSTHYMLCKNTALRRCRYFHLLHGKGEVTDDAPVLAVAGLPTTVACHASVFAMRWQFGMQHRTAAGRDNEVCLQNFWADAALRLIFHFQLREVWTLHCVCLSGSTSVQFRLQHHSLSLLARFFLFFFVGYPTKQSTY